MGVCRYEKMPPAMSRAVMKKMKKRFRSENATMP
jgi:hypothetical protein